MDILFANAWYWIIGGALLAGLEILVPGIFLLWIGLGAVVVGLLLAAFPGLSDAWQLLIFAGAMLASIGIGVFVQRRGRSAPNATQLNCELSNMVGRTFIAVDDFIVGHGRVRVGDTTYSAVSTEPVAANSTVRVMAIDGNRLRVLPYQEPDSAHPHPFPSAHLPQAGGKADGARVVP
jgi:membrane protein implicated in regulation of membrane protease activity